MAALNFPANPVDGQLFPDPLPPGQQQYIYSSSKNTWQTVSQAVAQVFGIAPVVIRGPRTAPIVTVNPASTTQPGYISTSDYNKIQAVPAIPGTVTEIVAGAGLNVSPTGDELQVAGGSITTSGTLSVAPATKTAIGGVTPGQSLSVNGTGVMDVAPATATSIGGVIPGFGISVTPNGTISVNTDVKSFVILDSLAGQFDGVTTTFQLTVENVPVIPGNVNYVWIFLGGIFQTPNQSFTCPASGSTIIFSEPPPNGANFYGVVFL